MNWKKIHSIILSVTCHLDVGHAVVGWGGLCHGEVGGVGHTGVRWGGSCRVGWVIQGLVGVGHAVKQPKNYSP